MRVLVGCEFSGRVRDTFRKRGVEAWSCDLIETTVPSEFHIIGDILDVIRMGGWDMLICFPPCTYLTIAGNRWHAGSQQRKDSIEFVKSLWNCGIEHIAIENPVGVLSTQFLPPTQIIQPYHFGHPEPKRTSIWLKNLPKLRPTSIVKPGPSQIHHYGHSYENSAQVRSLTYHGIAEAMADQWQPSEIQKHLASQEENLLLQKQKKTKSSQKVILITGLTALPDPRGTNNNVQSSS